MDGLREQSWTHWNDYIKCLNVIANESKKCKKGYQAIISLYWLHFQSVFFPHLCTYVIDIELIFTWSKIRNEEFRLWSSMQMPSQPTWLSIQWWRVEPSFLGWKRSFSEDGKESPLSIKRWKQVQLKLWQAEKFDKKQMIYFCDVPQH